MIEYLQYWEKLAKLFCQKEAVNNSYSSYQNAQAERKPRDNASLETLIHVAGQRWKIEQGFETAKGECGLDKYDVRCWGSWTVTSP